MQLTDAVQLRPFLFPGSAERITSLETDVGRLAEYQEDLRRWGEMAAECSVRDDQHVQDLFLLRARALGHAHFLRRVDGEVRRSYRIYTPKAFSQTGADLLNLPDNIVSSALSEADNTLEIIRAKLTAAALVRCVLAPGGELNDAKDNELLAMTAPRPALQFSDPASASPPNVGTGNQTGPKSTTAAASRSKSGNSNPVDERTEHQRDVDRCILTELKKKSPMDMAALQLATGYKPSSLSKRTKPLQEQGLIERRKNKYHITDKGKKTAP